MIERMKSAGFAALLAFFSLAATSAFADQTVTLLDRGEPYDTMVFDNGTLWVGHSRKDFNTNYRLEAYSAEGRLIDSVGLSHSLTTIKGAGDGVVMITGLNPSSKLTRYTRAMLKNGKISLATREIAPGGYIYFWIGQLDGLQYFADQGGNSDDTSPPDTPAQTIFHSRGTDFNYIKARLRMPVSGVVHNGKFLMVSSDGIGLPGARLVEVDPASTSQRVLVETKTARFKKVEIIPETSDAVLTAQEERKLLVVDTSSGAIKRELPTSGNPRSFDFIGSCVVVGNDETNNIEVFDLREADNTPRATFPVKLPANEFSGIKRIAVDPDSGMVFARANLPCNPLADKCVADYNRVIKFDDAIAAKVKSSCK